MATTVASGVASWPGPSQSVTPGGRALFAKGLAKGCTSAHLQALFSQIGTVTDCQIARHRSGRSAGFAIVTFLRHEEAVSAMRMFDNYIYMGRRLSVKWFSPERALEGNTQGVDALNIQALQHALQFSQLQPADLMAQLAQMLESPRIPTQQPQNPHVTAWLDNFILAHQRDSPLAQPICDATPPQPPLDLLAFSALSLGEVPGAALGLPPATGFTTHPNTPSAMDVPDGAVFVTATAFQNVAKGATGAPGAGTPSNLALAHSRLSKWCTAPGSAGGQSSAAQSLADDASSASETASVHASDDSSVATTTVPMGANGAGEPTSCSTEGTSPGLLAMSDPASVGGAPPTTTTTATTATNSPVRPLAPHAANCISSPGTAPQSISATTSLPLPDCTEELLRNRNLAAVMPSRPGVFSSDPGNMNPLLGKRGPSFTSGQQQQSQSSQVVAAAAAAAAAAAQPLLPGAPVLAPLRTVPSAPPPTSHHHHHHHHHAPRNGTQSARQSASMIPPYSSCGGGAAAAAATSAAAPSTSPDSNLHQALRLQQALAEQARTMSAQQQYVDALAKLAAARDQVMAAASLLTSSSSGGMTPALPLPPVLAAAAGAHHPHHMAPPPPSAAAAASLMSHHHHPSMAGSVNPYLGASQTPTSSAGVPDLSALLMFQNAAAMNRPLY